MPIIKIDKVTGNRHLALWKITEDFNRLLDELDPTPEINDMLARYRSELKKKEWLAGRLALRALTHKLKLPYTGVAKTEFGKPLLCSGNGEISLTHSYPYVAALLDDKCDPVGIDLEQRTPKLFNISRKFLTDQEMDFARNDLTKLCICWCVKEALYKIYSKKGVSFREHLLIESFDLNPTGMISARIVIDNFKKIYNLQYIVEEEYVLAYNLD